MNAQIRPSFAELTTPLLSPDIMGSFEALADGRCSLPELNESVLDACRSDVKATAGVLLLLESYASTEEFARFDFGLLKRALARALDARDDASTQGFMEHGDQKADVPVRLPINEPGMLLGRYILEAEIGRGGASTVYRALDLNRAGLPPEHRHVALKILRENAARRPEAVEALRREYHQARSLSHPGIVKVFDLHHDGDAHFVTMELLDGESLREVTRRLLPNKLPLKAATRILRELGGAILYAHDRGVLHLDLKPDNVMIDTDGHVRVLDFGMAQTLTGELRGPLAATPAYASCERLWQERPDVRDDVFSFSCIAYELLAGKHPFDRSSALKARKDGCKAPRIPNLSRRQWAALEGGLAWARESRSANMRELLQGLELHSSATLTRGARWQRAAAVTLVILGSAALLNWARIQGRNQSLDETSAIAVDAKPVPEGAAEDVRRNTPDAYSVNHVSSQVEPETSQSTKPASTLEIESEDPVAQPRSLPADTQVETDDVQVRPARGSSRPRQVSAAGEAPAVVPRAAAAPADVLGFSRHSFSVSEADPVVHVNVSRLGDATGDIAFQWYTVDDSARAGQDYVYEFGEVLMAPGQTTATFDVPIIADTIRENPELLQVTIGNARGAKVSAGRVPIIIVDDD